MREGYLTIAELSKETNIPESTVRRYVENHHKALRTKKTSRRAWLLHKDDVPLLIEIRKCYEQHMSIQEVENHLLQSGQPITITIGEEEKAITPAEAFSNMVLEIQSLREEIAELKREQKEQAHDQKAKIDDLRNDIQFVGETISRVERERQKRKEQGLLKRLFGKG